METDPDTQQEILQLEQQLQEVAAASNFFETASGRLIVDLCTRRINQSINKITSDKFAKDHMGYVNELAWLRANRLLLASMYAAKSPARKAKIEEQIDGLK